MHDDETTAASVDTAVLERYRSTYYFSPEATLEPELVLDHWVLEKQLTQRILASDPEDRWKVTEDCYTELYERLSWHRELPRSPKKARDFSDWFAIVGDEPLDVYEIGSGEGELIKGLADRGHRCRATEITTERGSRHDPDEKISWGTSDGVHLDRFEQAASFDLVISNQVIEHLHPDDLDAHLRSARALLRPGGRYIMSVPHRLTGPHDVSEVFGRLDAEAMHLREYTWAELSKGMQAAGFATTSAASTVRLEPKLAGLPFSGPWVRPALGGTYLQVMKALEAMLLLVPDRARQQQLSRRLKAKKVFADNIFLVGRNSDG